MKKIIIGLSVLAGIFVVLLAISYAQDVISSNQSLDKTASLVCNGEEFSVKIPQDYLEYKSNNQLDIMDPKFNIIEKIANFIRRSEYIKIITITCKINNIGSIENLKDKLKNASDSSSDLSGVVPQPKDLTINGYNAIDSRIDQKQARKYKTDVGAIFLLTNKTWFTVREASFNFNEKMFEKIINGITIKED